MQRTIFLMSLFLILLAAPLVRAAGDEEAPPKPFTAAELDKFIADWPAFKTWADERYGKNQTPGAWEALSLNTDIHSYLKKKGWDSERFFQVMARATEGLLLIEMKSAMPDAAASLEAQRPMIENAPDLSEAQKQEALKELDKMIAETRAASTGGDSDMSPAELKVVEARRDELKKLFEID